MNSLCDTDRKIQRSSSDRVYPVKQTLTKRRVCRIKENFPKCDRPFYHEKKIHKMEILEKGVFQRYRKMYLL